MTNKEASEWLFSIKGKYIFGGDEKFDRCRHEALDLAITLLREREPTEPLIEKFGNISKIYGCPACKKMLYRGQLFCDECGKALKWE